MHPDRIHFEKHIREGNQSLATDLNRCLDIHQSPLESRPYPVNWAHWTEEEFYAFLIQYNFPSNTIRDRLTARRYGLRAALESGKFVPAVVMQGEGMEEIVNDAIMMVRSALYSEIALQMDKEQAIRFEKMMGFWHSQEKYTEMKKLLLRAAFVQGQRPCPSCLTVQMPLWESGSVTVKLIEEVRPRHGRFGVTFSGIEKHIQIKNGANPHYYSSLMTFKWKEIEPLIVEMMRAGEIGIEQIWLLTGSSWIPPGPVQIQVIRSHEGENHNTSVP